MTEKEAIEKLRALEDIDDCETAHIEADRTVHDFLVGLGYVEIANSYAKVPKWYS